MKAKLIEKFKQWHGMYPEDVFPPLVISELRAHILDANLGDLLSIEAVYADCARRILNLVINEIEKTIEEQIKINHPGDGAIPKDGDDVLFYLEDKDGVSHLIFKDITSDFYKNLIYDKNTLIVGWITIPKFKRLR